MTRTPPLACNSMAELRPQIDAIDAELIALLSERAGYIDRAVDLKRIENLPARTVDRVAEVLANVRRMAREQELDEELAASLWHTLIEWSIDRESEHLDS